MSLLLLPLGFWASTALHELAHYAAFRLAGMPVLAVGTRWPPIRLRVRLGGTLFYVGVTDMLSGRAIPGEGRLSPVRSALVSAAGPAMNLLQAVALIAWPSDAFPLLRALLAAWNVYRFLDNAVPGYARSGGNDGAHVREKLGGPRIPTVPSRLYHLCRLYEALGVNDRACHSHQRLVHGLANQELPRAARVHLDALRAHVGTDASWADRIALGEGLVAQAAGRHDDATAALGALSSRDCEPAWVARAARSAPAWAHAERGDPTRPYTPEAPEQEHAELVALVDFGHGCARATSTGPSAARSPPRGSDRRGARPGSRARRVDPRREARPRVVNTSPPPR